MIHLFHLVLNVLTFFFLEMVLIMKNISGQEVKKLIAFKQKNTNGNAFNRSNTSYQKFMSNL